MKNGEEKSYVIADREDASDPDQVSDISEPEIINSSSYSNGGGYENIMLFVYLILTDLRVNVMY